MTEIWLRSNRRVLSMAVVPTALVTAVGALLIATGDAVIFRVVGWILIVGGALLTLGLINQLRRPRIAYRDGEVLFHLRAGAPVAVPREAVEAFFLGQGPAHLPLNAGRRAESVNLVARLSQKAPQWMHVEVKPALGRWCEGYVTIRGTWCEPLNGDIVRRLNARLRELRAADQGEAALPTPSSPSEGEA